METIKKLGDGRIMFEGQIYKDERSKMVIPIEVFSKSNHPDFMDILYKHLKDSGVLAASQFRQTEDKWKPEDGDKVCQTCGSENVTWFADNDLFNKVNGSPNGIMCPLCFEKKAIEIGINNILFHAEVPASPAKEEGGGE